MKKYLCLIFLPVLMINVSMAQKPSEKAPEKSKENKDHKLNRKLDLDYLVTHEKEAIINGKKIPYKVRTGVLPVWDKNDQVVAGVFYTYYERSDVANKAERPILFSFNGGPGSASVWMMLGYTGPRLLNIDEEGYPVQPYGLRDNPNSVLDVTDLVYVDPVMTGFSRPLDQDVDKSQFFGVNEDVKYLAGWINHFVNTYKRWASPKYLIGESYGTTRVSGLAMELQSNYWMYLNGVVLVSPTTLGIEQNSSVRTSLYVPYYAATAWYHKALNSGLQSRTLQDLLKEVEQFTVDTYLPAIAQGGALGNEQRMKIVSKLSQYTGISEKAILENNLVIPMSYYWKELLRNQGKTVGRLDSRYIGMDLDDSGESPDYNAELTSWLHAFTPAINMYLRDELGYKSDLTYNMLVGVGPWNRSSDQTGANLAKAMTQNPFLHVLVQSGYYDGACDYFNSKYNIWQMDRAGRLSERISWKGYECGHMMYVRKPDLVSANEDLRTFITTSIPKSGQPAKY